MLTVRRTAFSVALYLSLPAASLHVTLPTHENDTSNSTFKFYVGTHTISRIGAMAMRSTRALSARTLGRVSRLFYIMHGVEENV